MKLLCPSGVRYPFSLSHVTVVVWPYNRFGAACRDGSTWKLNNRGKINKTWKVD